VKSTITQHSAADCLISLIYGIELKHMKCYVSLSSSSRGQRWQWWQCDI